MDTGSVKISFAEETVENTMPSGNSSTKNYYVVPKTSESLTDQLTSEDSAVIRNDAQYENAAVVKSEAGGDIGLELNFAPWFLKMLQAVMRAEETVLPEVEYATPTPLTLTNAKKARTFTFHKEMTDGEGVTHHWDFTGSKFGALSLEFGANTLNKASVTVISRGTNVSNTDASMESVPADADITTSMNYQFNTNNVVMVFKDETGSVIDVEVESLNLELTSNLRTRPGVGSLAPIGVSPGRFGASLSGSLYFLNRKPYDQYKNDKPISLEITMSDTDNNNETIPANTHSETNSLVLEFKKIKVTKAEITAGGVDADLMIDTELRAVADDEATPKTLRVTMNAKSGGALV